MYCTFVEILLRNQCLLVKWKQLRYWTLDSSFTLDLMYLQDILPIVVDATVITFEGPMKFDNETDVHLILKGLFDQ